MVKSLEQKNIVVRGAKTHNLKKINVSIPRNKITVVTGVSGSGKTSFAFDTIFAEGQRRYVQSLSTYARQFVSLMDKPEVESITGLSPAISIEQKAGMHNPRSTVGTVTEVYDYMRLIFARIGTAHCPEHNYPLKSQSISQIVDQVLKLPEDKKIMIIAPLLQDKKGQRQELLDQLRHQGFIRIRLNGKIQELDMSTALPEHKKNTLEVIVDRLKVKNEHQQRLAESIETAINLSGSTVLIAGIDDSSSLLFSTKLACPDCGFSCPDISPKNFSFNNPQGACPDCEGLGAKQTIDLNKIIVDPDLSIAHGVIKGWDKHQSYYYQMLVGLSIHYNFDINTPWKDLSESIKDIILYGSKEIIAYADMGLRGRFRITNRRFEGIFNILERRYNETDSETVRNDLNKYFSKQLCSSCKGTRLSLIARNIFIEKESIPSLVNLSIDKLYKKLKSWKLSPQDTTVATPILHEILSRLGFLLNVGLEYLNLSRPAETLSGGEAQRIRLASQIGCGLTGVMYILDEPSIGLHQRDNQRLINTLFTLRELGNTVIVIEHDEDTMMQADHIIDIGPEAGTNGGHLIASCSPKEIVKIDKSITGRYLSGKEFIPVPKKRKNNNLSKQLSITKISTNNLKNVNLNIPIGLISVITGVSGSGKSSLINETLFPAVHNRLERYDKVQCEGSYEDIEGTSFIDKIIRIDQSPIGRTPRSNPATYTGMFTIIRDLFSQVPEARARGYTAGRFSFNVKGGRCEACQGDGLKRVEMHFLADIYVKCDICQGKRYNRETLNITYKGYNIDEILNMSVKHATQFFSSVPAISRKLETLMSVGLGYINLGQSATTLSGGEAQRLKLSRELAKKSTGRTLYLLDEPTTGLHFQDIKQLLKVLDTLAEHGNTIIIIEHNMDVIKTADWVIDIGPEGGDKGGNIIGEGTPEDIAKIEKSHTGKFLKPLIKKS